MLEIRNLSVSIGPHEIVSIEHFDLPAGRRMGLVGESGSGKTMTAMSIIGLQPREAVVTGSIMFEGVEIVGRDEKELSKIRGSDVGVIFQDPLRALNPTMRIGRQVGEVIRLHEPTSRAEIRKRIIELLQQVQLPDPEGMARRYPHQLSGGQRQRVLIAMAIACNPKLLIADEPTTALDVTVQKEILELLKRLSVERGMSVLFVSHDLGVIRAVSEHVAVVYGGHLVETGDVETVINESRHRYTEALIGANPGHPEDVDAVLGTPLDTIRGSVPALGGFPSGCRFRGRCPHETTACAEDPPVTVETGGHRYKCWNPAVPVSGATGDSTGSER